MLQLFFFKKKYPSKFDLCQKTISITYLSQHNYKAPISKKYSTKKGKDSKLKKNTWQKFSKGNSNWKKGALKTLIKKESMKMAKYCQKLTNYYFFLSAGIDLKSNHAFSPKINVHSMASKEFPLQPNCSLPELRLGPISGHFQSKPEVTPKLTPWKNPPKPNYASSTIPWNRIWSRLL